MSDKERQLYCGNLSEKVTEDVLYELFLQAGPLESVTIPKDKDGKPRRFAFITFKHAVSVPYTMALMNGISLFGKTLQLDNRTGAESEHNPFLEKLNHYQNSLGHPNRVINRSYNQRETYEESNRRYDSRRYESRPETQRVDSNMWNKYPVSSSAPYGIGPAVVYAPHLQNQSRYVQNSMPQPQYQYGNQMPWPRNHR